MTVTAKGPAKSTYMERVELAAFLRKQAASEQRSIEMSGPYEATMSRVTKPIIAKLLRAADVILEKRR